MSNRTSEANKAISLAWSKEQQLVREGKGTRDWKPEQQQDLLVRGKVYDDDGKAFEGHHMKSAEKFPQYQGDPENIQFLSRSEHFAAHDGNFHNATNGYFNPSTGETLDFGLNKHEPCEILKLSQPIISTGSQAQRTVDAETTSYTNKGETNTSASISRGLTNPKKSGFGDSINQIIGKAENFYLQNKAVIDAGIVLATTVSDVVTIINSLSGGPKSSTNNYKNGNHNLTKLDISLEHSSPLEHPSSLEHSSPIKRSSPTEHTVSRHSQRYNNVLKEKEPYKRGKQQDY